MTKSTITREPITHDLKIYPEYFSAVCTGVKRAELRKNDRDYRVGDTLHLTETPRGSCHQTGEFINVKITHIADVGEWMPGYVLLSVELQERRKSAMDSEPVAEVVSIYGDPEAFGEREIRPLVGIQQMPYGTKLYRHAQPAPVVPVGLEHLRSIVADPRLLPRRKEWIGGQQYSYVLLEEVEAMVDEACRAAMLQVGNFPAHHDCCPAQNSVAPAQSHGWIPVSERMPIEFEAVIAFDGDQVYGEAMYSSDDGFTIDGYEPCDRLNLRNVTHWMPLPSAPQEVK